MGQMLIDEYPLMVLPTLVKLLGLEQALVLQQINFHLNTPKSGTFIDGNKWIWNTYEQWTEDFPFWKWKTIQKWILRLEKNGYLISAQFDKEDWNQRKYYRVNHEFLTEKILEVQQNQTVSDRRRARVNDRRPASTRDRRPANTHDRRLSHRGTETSSETTPETSPETSQDLNYSKANNLRRDSAQPAFPQSVSDLTQGTIIEPLDGPSVPNENTSFLLVRDCADTHAGDAGEIQGQFAESDSRENTPVVKPGLAVVRENGLTRTMRRASLSKETVTSKGSEVSCDNSEKVIQISTCQSPLFCAESPVSEFSTEFSTGKKSKKKEPADPRATHLAIVALRDIRKQFPPKELWDEIIATIGDVPDLEKLRKCYAELLKRGASKNAWYWAIDWYRDGIPEFVKQKPKSEGRAIDYEIIRSVGRRVPGRS